MFFAEILGNVRKPSEIITRDQVLVTDAGSFVMDSEYVSQTVKDINGNLVTIN